MKLGGREKRAVHELSDAINFAIEESSVVADAIENLREMGFEPNLNLRLEIALQEIVGAMKDVPEDVSLDLTEDDLRTLSRMKIRIEQ